MHLPVSMVPFAKQLLGKQFESHAYKLNETEINLSNQKKKI